MTSATAPNYQKWIAIFTGVLAMAIVIYFIGLVRPLILYLLFAYFFVTAFRGVVSEIRHQTKMPEWCSYTAIGIGLVLFVSLFTFIITDTIQDLLKVQSMYTGMLADRIGVLEQWIQQTLGVQKLDIRSSIKEIPIQPILSQVVNNTVFIFQLLFTFIIFMIAEILDNYAQMTDHLNVRQTHLYQVMSRFQQNIQRYILIKSFISLGTALMVYLILSIFSVDFALLWAMLTFLLNYVPVVGSVIATLLPFSVIFVTNSVGVSLGILTLMGVNQLFWGQFLDPKLIGDEFNLKFKTILVSLFLWGSLLGVGGVVLAPLLTLAFKLISEGYDEWRWFSVIVSRRYDPSVEHS